LVEDQSTVATAERVEAKYRAIREAKGAPRKPRKMYAGGDDDRTETCFINSPTWLRRNEEVYCPDWADSSLALETALDLRNARSAISKANRANRLAWFANILAIIAIIIAVIMKIIS
jgi:hypothetical protein